MQPKMNRALILKGASKLIWNISRFVTLLLALYDKIKQYNKRQRFHCGERTASSANVPCDDGNILHFQKKRRESNEKELKKTISIAIAAVMMASSLSLGAAAAESTLKGDVNRDGVVNINDATILQQYLAEFDDVRALPCRIRGSRRTRLNHLWRSRKNPQPQIDRRFKATWQCDRLRRFWEYRRQGRRCHFQFWRSQFIRSRHETNVKLRPIQSSCAAYKYKIFRS